MGLSRRQFTKEFKLAAVRRLEQGISMGEVARGMEVNPNVLHRWRKEFRAGPGNAFSGNGNQRWSEGEIAKLERKVGQQTLEIDFLKECLRRWPRALRHGVLILDKADQRGFAQGQETRMLQAVAGNPQPSGKSKKK